MSYMGGGSNCPFSLSLSHTHSSGVTPASFLDCERSGDRKGGRTALRAFFAEKRHINVSIIAGSQRCPLGEEGKTRSRAKA